MELDLVDAAAHGEVEEGWRSLRGEHAGDGQGGDIAGVAAGNEIWIAAQ